MASKIIGFVVELTGSAQVRTLEGVIKVLSIGDTVSEGDLLITGLNTQIVLEFFDGRSLQVGASTELLLDETVFAGLDAFADDRVDQLAELQSQIMEGLDLDDLEAPAAGAASDSDALHEASIYLREGEVGFVETRATPFDLNAIDDNDPFRPDDDLFIPENRDVENPASTTPINVAPVAVDDVITSIQNVPFNSSASLDFNDTDLDGDVLSVIAGTFTTVQGGTIVLAADGSYTYTPPANFIGVDSLDYTVTDGSLTDIGTLTINVVNDAPVAVDDSVTATEDTVFNSTIDLDDNDTDLNGDALSVVAGTFATTQGGSITIAVDGSYSYTPAANFNGVDSVDYTVTDGGSTDTGTLTINVTAVNDAPLAVADVETTAENAILNTSVPAASDVDGTIAPNGYALGGTTVAQGNLVFNADGSYSFDPGTDFDDLALGATRDVTFTYTATDNDAAVSAEQTVTITVTGTNDAPVAVADATTTTEDSVLNGIVPAAADVDGTIDPNGYAVGGTTVAQGALVFNADGSYSFDPGNDFDDLAVGATRDVTFTYTATDNNGAVSAEETVTITVTGTNDAPVAVADAVGTTENAMLNTSVPAASDADGTVDPNGYALGGTTVAQGSLVFNADGSYSFDPGTDFDDLAIGAVRDVTFTYTATDNNGAVSAEETVTITVTGTNDAPVAVADAVGTADNTILSTSVPAASDVDGTIDPNGYALGGSSVAQGSLVFNADGTYSFDPGTDFDDLAIGATRDVTFTYTATDNNGASSAEQTVTITVTGTNDAPVAVADAVGTSENTVLNASVPAASDVDGTVDPNGYALGGTNVTQGSLVFNVDGSYSFDPGSDFDDLAAGVTRDVTFTYTASDNDGGVSAEQTVTITVTGTNDAPVAVVDAVGTSENVVLNGNVPAASDVDGSVDPNGYALGGTSVAQGTLVFNADGSYSFDPGTDFDDLAVGATRDVTFTYTATDNDAAVSAEQTVTITVTGTNDAPVAVADAVGTSENTILNANVPAASDVDGLIDPNGYVLGSTTVAQGSLTFNADGSYSFDPVTDFDDLAVGATRDVTFTYTATDNNGAVSAEQTVTITVTGTNDAPVAVADAVGTTENAVLNGSVPAASDVDGTIDPNGYTVGGTTVAQGSLVFNADGSYSFDPGTDFDDLAVGATRDVTFTYTATDNNGAVSAEQTVTITVTGTNDAPVAVADAVGTSENAVLNGNVPAASDVDGTIDPSGYAIGSTTVAQGSLVFNADGSYSFDPGTDFDDLAVGATRDVTFTYTATDNDAALSAEQTVTITVTGTNDAPVAVADAVGTTENTVLNANVPAASDVDGTIDPNGYAIGGTTVAQGSLVFNADGSYSFDPGTDFDDLAVGATRDVTFTYTATDNDAAVSAEQTVIITVTGTNDAPVAVADAVGTTENTVLNANVPAASDVDGTIDPNGYAIGGTTVAQGSLGFNADGSYSFDPGTDFDDLAVGATRDVTFTYTATDNNGGVSAEQTVTITVTGTNDAPVAVADAVGTTENATLNSSVPAASDVDGTIDPNGYALGGSTVAQGSLAFNADGSYSFDPGNDFDDLAVGATRDVTFTYTATDNNGAVSAEQTVTITVTGTNDAPVAVADAVGTTENTVLNANVPAASDVDGTIDPNGYVIGGTTVAQGSLVFNADGSYSFDPGADFDDLAVGATRDVTFTYTATDNNGGVSAEQTVTITVTGTNDAPVAVADAVGTSEETVLNGSVPVASDVDGTVDPNGYTLGGTTVAQGSLSFNADGSYSFDPGMDFDDLAVGATRDVTFTYTATDNNGAVSAEQTVTITVTGTNDAPVAVADAVGTTENAILNTSVPAASDVDGSIDPNGYAIGGTTVAQGSLGFNADGSYSFDPGTDFDDLAVGATRDVTFTYTATDNNGAISAEQTVTITVTGTNDAPVAVADAVGTTENAILNSSVPVASDVDGTIDPNGYALGGSTVAQGSLGFNADGSYSFDPGTDFDDLAVGATRDVTFTYTATDNNGAISAEQTVTITVTGTNDAPVAVADAVAVAENAVLNGNVPAASDVDGTIDPNGYAIGGTTVAEGSLVLNADGSYSFNPGADFNDLAVGASRDVTFTYTATDNNGAVSAEQTVTITVTGTNDVPVAVADAVGTGENTILNDNVPAASDVDGTVDPNGYALGGTTVGEGSLVFNADGSYSFDPGTDFDDLAVGATRDVTFTYTATDNSGASSAEETVTITVTGTNDAPVAVADTVGTAESAILNTSVPAASDVDGSIDPNGYALGGTTVAEGNLVFNADGSYSFDPGTDFDDLAVGATRAVTFTYTATDNDGAISTEQTVTITVTGGTNSAPVAVADAVGTGENTILNDNVPAASDVDGTVDPNGYAIGGTTVGEGSLVFNTDGSYSFDPGTDFDDLAVGATRDVTFTYTATDNLGAVSAEETVTITVTGTNDAPVAVADAVGTTENTILNTSVPAASDVDGTIDPNGYALGGTSVAQGSLSFNADGTYSFDPGVDFDDLAVGATRDVTFTYTATDNSGAVSAEQPVTITVTGTNDVPVAVADAVATTENAILNSSVPAASDVDGTIDANGYALGATVVAQGSLVFNTDGSYSFDPGTDFDDLAVGATRDVTFTYTASDNNGGVSAEQTVTITVTGTNDAPVAVADAVGTGENTILNDNVPAASDVDGTVDPNGYAIGGTTVAQGSLVFNTDGSYSFDPGTDFDDLAVGATRDVTFTYTATDNNGAISAEQPVTITVTGTNDAPVAVADAVGTSENTILNANVPAASDVDGSVDPNGYALGGSTVAQGSLVFNADGSYSFNPGTDFDDLAVGATRDVTFTYTASDNNGGVSAEQTVTITVTGTNDAPVAVADAVGTTENTMLNANVPAASDVDGTIDPNGYGLGATTVAQGSLVFNADGSYSFDPGTDFDDLAVGATRDVTFTYTATDNNGAVSTEEMVTITVTGTNDAPVAVADAVGTGENTILNANVPVASDVDGTIDPNGYGLGATTVAQGSLVFNTDGSYSFDPGTDFDDLAVGATRDVTFTYTVTDNNGAVSAEEMVTITVTGTNDAPIAVADAVGTTENTILSANVPAASDVDGTVDPNGYAIGGATVGQGSLVFNTDGSYSFDPGTDFDDLAVGATRDVTFTYTAMDNDGAVSAEETVTITVTGTNDAPVAVADAVGTTENAILNTSVPAASDVDGTVDPNGYALGGTTVAQGSLVFNANGSYSFNPGADFDDLAVGATRDVTFTYTATDNNGASSAEQTVTITVTGTNDAPVAVADAVGTSENAVLNTNVPVASDADGSIDPNGYALGGTTVAQGSLVFNADGSYSFNPGTDFDDLAVGATRDVTFTYTATDNNGALSAEETVTITVTGTNDAPIAVADAAGTGENTILNANVPVASDVDGTVDPNGYALGGTTVAQGSLVFNANGSYSFDPGTDFDDLAVGATRDVTFTYTASDNNGASSAEQTVTITVTGTNDAPVAVADAVGTSENTTLNANVPTASDVDGTIDPNGYALGGTTVAQGSLVFNADGSYSFDPGTDFDDLAVGATRDVTFTYTASDNNAAISAEQTVTITVTGTNDAPVAVADAVGTTENTILNTAVPAASDVDGTVDPNGYALGGTTVAQGALVFNADGSYSFNPGTDFDDLAIGATRDVNFTYTVTDNDGAVSAEQTVTITVTGTNDAPIAVADAVGTTENTTLNANVPAASDVDGTIDPNGYALGGTTVAQGGLVFNADGSYSFNPGTDFDDLAVGATRDVTFTYTATDNNGAVSAEETITITVTGTNDAPVAVADAVGTTENTLLNANVPAASDVDGTIDLNGYALGGTTVAEGSLVFNADGSYSFDPGSDFDDLAAGASRDVSFTYTATDNNGAVSAEQTVTITVTGNNNAPVAVADATGTTENAILNANVPAASDVDGTIDLNGYALGGTTVSQGILVFNSDGSYSFNPGTDFDDLAVGATRDVTFTYTATDNLGAVSAEETVTITVTGTNDAPVAVADAVGTTENAILNTSVPAASDIDGTVDPSGYALGGTTVAQGSLVFNANGSYSFNPGTDFDDLAVGATRDVTFTYTATDNDGAVSAEETVTITVTGTNDAPVAVADAVGTTENAILNTSVPAASDVDGTVDPNGFALGGTTVAQGSLIFNADGSYSFNPGTDFDDLAVGATRDVTFTYTATDNDGAVSAEETVTITVTGTNDAPVAVADAVGTTENAILNTSVPAASDVDGTVDPNGFALGGTTVAQGSLIFNADGSYSFNPGTDFDDLAVGATRDVTFTYTATDNDGAASAEETVTITVTGTNDAPVAVADAVGTTENAILNTSVPAASDIDGTVDPNGYALGGTTVAQGSLVFNADGSYSFNPGTDFDDLSVGATRDVTFTYTATDNDGTASAEETVTITVTGTNDAPVAVADAVGTTENAILNTSVPAASDVDGTVDPNGYALGGTTVAQGALVFNADGSYSFNPGTDFDDLAVGATRDVTFTYTATDNDGAASAEQTVTITVTGTNDAPVAVADAVGTTENAILNTSVPAASDVDGTVDPNGYALGGTTVAQGSLVFNADGSYSFNPGTDFDDLSIGATRDVTFTYTVTDSDGAISAEQTVTITVTGTNDAPIAVADAVGTTENAILNTSVPAASDVDGTIDPNGYVLGGTTVAQGSLVFNADGSYSFNPGTDFDDLAIGATRDVTFTYTATDNNGAISAEETVTITVTGTNDAPVAVADAVGTTENAILNTSVPVASDVDGTVDPNGYALGGTTVAQGSLVFNADGSYSFDPGTDFDDLAVGATRDVTFTYTATDNDGAVSAEETMTITVTGTNDAPVAVADAVGTTENTLLNANVPAASDVDGTVDPNGYALGGTTVAQGSLVFNADGSYSFDPGTDFDDLAVGATRDVTFTYTATDNDGAASAEETVTITVTGTNDAPVAVADAVGTTENAILNTSVPAASDVDGTVDPNGYALGGTTVAQGALVFNADGSYSFDPGTDFDDLAVGATRDVTFTYTATDNNGAVSAEETVTITVTGTNDAPVAVADAVGTTENAILNTSVPVASDVDGTVDPNGYALGGTTVAQGSLVFNADGSYSFNPGTDFDDLAIGATRDVTFTYTATDNDGAVSAEQTVTITVTGTNDAPVAAADAVGTTENTILTTAVPAASDVDGTVDPNGYGLGGTTVAQGSLAFNADGSYSFDPGTDFDDLAVGATRDVTFTYTATDNNGAVSAEETVTITVTGTNDAPVAVADAVGTTENAILNTSVPVASDVDGTVDPNGYALGGTMVAQGGLVFNADGSYSFNPGTDFDDLAVGATRDVTFTYTATDNGGAVSAEQTVTITVTGTNDAPVAVADAVGTTENTILNGSVPVASDVDGTVDPNGYVLGGTTVAQGALVFNADGSYSFNPGTDFDDLAVGATRDVIFTYTATDNDGAVSAEQSVTITVTGTNDDPVAVDDTVSATEDTVFNSVIDLDQNDTDLDGDALSVIAGTFATTQGGSITIAANGSYTYTPAADFNGVDSVDYTVTDGVATDVATLTINVAALPDPPVVDLDANDSAAPGNDYAVTFNEGGSAVYIADADISITDADDTNIASATISIAGVESGDLLTVGAIPAGITASAYDAVTGTITLSGSAPLADYQTAIRAVQFSNDGSSTSLSRSIDVVVSDGVSSSNVASTDVTLVTLPTVSITDVSVQEPGSGTTLMTFTISIDQMLGSDLTFDYATADISTLAGTDYVQLSSTVGSIVAGATSTTVTVTVNSDTNPFEGDETLALNLTNFNQTVNFGAGAHIIGGGVQGIGTIGANNGPPVAVDDSYITTADTPLTITNALANDTLVDNAVVDVSGFTDDGGGMYSFSGTNGNVVYDANTGEFTFTPTGGYSGPASFSYTLIDDDGETDTANVSIDVSNVAVNPPTVTAVPDTFYVENDAPTTLLTGVSIADVDSSSLSSVVVTVNGYLSSQDVLSYLTAGTSVSASVSTIGSTWELTLSGGVDIGEYETVLDSITYQNSSDNPSTSVRNITVEAYDESYANLFGSDAGELSITAVNDAPDVFDSNLFVVEGSQDSALSITLPTDVDNDDASLVITITGLPSAIGNVTLNGTAVLVGQVLTLDELNSLEFDAGATPGDASFTYSVYDGDLTSVGTTAISVGSTNADTGTVYEGGLSGGTGSGSAQVSGNLFANDPSAGSSIDSIDFGATNEVPVAGVITVTTALGELVVYADNSTPGFTAGDYVYTLQTADLGGVDTSEAFDYNFTNSGTFSDTLTIAIIDDEPIASNLVQDVPESEENIFNIVFTLDDSGSMGWGAETGSNPPGAGESSRMDIAKDALEALGSEYFNQSTQVEITLITFNTNATFVGTYDNYADFETALNGVTPGGGTNYVDATSEIQTQLAADIGLQDPADDVQNISYFISDGAANAGTSPIGSGYFEFVNDNSVDSYSVGIGSSLPGDLSDLNYIHNIDSLGRGGGFVDDALIVADVSELSTELLSTVPTAFGGTITASGSIANVVFGGDGGYVQAVTVHIGGTDYEITYDGSTVVVPSPLDATVVVTGSTIELDADDGFIYGTFTFDFSDGSYTLSAPNNVAPADFEFDYIIVDNDGDSAMATATISIVDDSPDARHDLHTIEAYEVAAGNVITAQGSDGGPKFASSISPFATQGGGVDKVVDNATVTEFTYKDVTIAINTDDLIVVVEPPPTGTAEAVEITSQQNVDDSNFTIEGFDNGVPGTLNFDNGGGDRGVGVVGGGDDDRLNQDESLLITFDQTELPYGVQNLVLELNRWGGGGDSVEVILYELDNTTVIDTITHNGGDGDLIDLSAYTAIGSVSIEQTNGDSQLRNIDYEPVQGGGTSITPAGGNDGNLSWIYSHETDLDGNDVIQATVTDASDGSVFIMRSNGFYEYTPDSSGQVLTPEAVTTTSAANVAASDLTIVGFDNSGNPANLVYSANGLTVEGGWSNDRIDLGESVSIDFTVKGGNPNGVRNVQFTLTSAGAAEVITYLIYGLDGITLLGTETSSASPFTIDGADYPTVGRIEFVAGNSAYVRISNIAYDEITSAPPVNQDAILVDYVLTDTDNQSDTAQLAIYTIDQTLSGTTGVDNIAGGSLNDAIVGNAGDDILSGNAGDDSISGGDGDDILTGGVGNDYLSGGDGNDSLSGGAGSDTLDGNAGDDVVDGGTGDDIVLGGEGDDLVFGGSGADRLEGGAGDDVLNGGTGDDELFGDAGDDILIGGSGDDSLLGGAGIDIFALESGDEGSVGAPAVDTIGDFMVGTNGDVLDLSDMLQGEDLGSLADYFSFSFDIGTGDTTISVDVDGNSGVFETSQQIVLTDVDLTAGGTLSNQAILDNLLSSGNLIVDQ